MVDGVIGKLSAGIWLVIADGQVGVLPFESLDQWHGNTRVLIPQNADFPRTFKPLEYRRETVNGNQGRGDFISVKLRDFSSIAQ